MAGGCQQTNEQSSQYSPIRGTKRWNELRYNIGVMQKVPKAIGHSPRVCTDFKPGPFSRMKHSSSKVKSSVGWQVLRADESQQGSRGMMIPGHAKFAMLAASTIFSVRAAERLASEATPLFSAAPTPAQATGPPARIRGTGLYVRSIDERSYDS